MTTVHIYQDDHDSLWYWYLPDTYEQCGPFDTYKEAEENYIHNRKNCTNCDDV
jgi:hypothetical protein